MAPVTADQLSKTYRADHVDMPALRGVDSTIEPAAFVAFSAHRAAARAPSST